MWLFIIIKIIQRHHIGRDGFFYFKGIYNPQEGMWLPATNEANTYYHLRDGGMREVDNIWAFDNYSGERILWDL